MPPTDATTKPPPLAKPVYDAIIESDRLFCPACDYNLTGLTLNRCPECGTYFDRTHLRSLGGDTLRPAVPWDTDGGIGGFVRTWLLAVFMPARLASRFPGRHSAVHASAYGLICLVLTSVFYCTPAFIVGNGFGEAVLVALPGLLVFIWLLEYLVIRHLARAVPPTLSPNPHHFWRGLAHYTRGYWMLLVLPVNLLFFDNRVKIIVLSLGERLMILLGYTAIGLVFFLGWWLAWIFIILKRSRPTIQRTLTLVLLPLVLLAAACLGFLVSLAFSVPFTLLSKLWSP